MYEKYKHWEGCPEVWVRKDLKGKHREHCQCWEPYAKFHPEDRAKNCKRANLIFSVCVALDMTLPVWECPEFELQTEDKL